jgi:hypothetical protein
VPGLPPDAHAARADRPLAAPALARIEAAKRQLFYTLARLGLQGTADNAAAQASPRYALLADQPGGPAILTGHQGGTITLNVAEADDVERAAPPPGPARALPHAAGPPAA